MTAHGVDSLRQVGGARSRLSVTGIDDVGSNHKHGSRSTTKSPNSQTSHTPKDAPTGAAKKKHPPDAGGIGGLRVAAGVS
jgi:hypothetical protein